MTSRPPPYSARRRIAALAGLVFLVALLGSGSTGEADEDKDEHAVERAIEQGGIRPLSELLARIRRDIGGRVLEVEMERSSDGYRRRWVYEAKILTESGNVLKIDYDAATLELLRVKGRHEERPHEDDERD